MAKRKLKKGGFQSKIWNCCGTDDLRPVMQCAYIKDGFIYATDAHIAIKQSLESVHGIDPVEIKCLEGKLLHSKILKLLAKCEIVGFSQGKTLSISSRLFSGIFIIKQTFGIAFITD